MPRDLAFERDILRHVVIKRGRQGRVTFARISQAQGQPRMVIAGGEMLERGMSFTGTSGVVRFDGTAADVMDDVIASGLEHHMGLVYGEHRAALRSASAAMGLPVLELGVRS